ncbi:MAG: hypothetical protein WCK98_00850 [bacterium]
MKSSKIIWIVLIAVMVISGGLGIYLYIKIDQSNKVSASINSSTDVLNNQAEKMNALLLQVQDISANLTQKTNFKDYLENIKPKNDEIASLVDETEASKNEIKAGPNSDTKEFANQTVLLLDARKKTLSSFKGIIYMSSCYVDKSISLTAWSEEYSAKWAALTADTPSADFVKLAKDTATKLSDNATTLPTIKDCFKDELSKYYTDEIKAEETLEVKVYQNLSASVSKIGDSVTVQKKADYDAANNEIAKTLKEESKYQQFLKESMQKAIRENTLTASTKVKNQEQIVQQLSDEIKDKYALNRTLKLF